jgi:hypothetical protein
MNSENKQVPSMRILAAKRHYSAFLVKGVALMDTLGASYV